MSGRALQIFGLTIARTTSLPRAVGGLHLFGLTVIRTKQLSPVDGQGGGWARWVGWPVVREPFAGAWSQNEEARLEDILTFAAVYACVTLIATDIAKMLCRVVARDGEGIWNESDSPPWAVRVLAKPNRYQNRVDFFTSWFLSLLLHGNTYVLKARDARTVVSAMYVLDPGRVRVLVAPDGSVFYELQVDNLANVPPDPVTGKGVIIPASEIMHDRINPLYHPLVGVSPIYACGMAALQGIRIQQNATRFFANGSKPGGVLTAPGEVSQETADRIKVYWDSNFSGENIGKVAVLGNGLAYQGMSISANESQLIQQLRWTAENVCTAYRVPPYMIGVGPPPNYNNIEALNMAYYSQCLQEKVERAELVLDDGLELNDPYGTEFDIDDLLRMDSKTQMSVIKEGVGAGVMKPNEGRLKLNLSPVTGGDTPYLQNQNWSLEALDKRENAPAPPPALPALPTAGPRPPAAREPAPAMDERTLIALCRKAWEECPAA